MCVRGGGGGNRVDLPPNSGVGDGRAHGRAAVKAGPALGTYAHVGRTAIAAVAAAVAALAPRCVQIVTAERVEVALGAHG
jgi:hypothetical protein